MENKKNIPKGIKIVFSLNVAKPRSSLICVGLSWSFESVADLRINFVLNNRHLDITIVHSSLYVTSCVIEYAEFRNNET